MPSIDLAGNDLTVNSISVRASTPGSAGTFERGPAYYVLKGVNMNSATTDNSLTIQLPTGVSRYAVSSVWLNNASASISTATIGVFTAASAGGQTIAADQAITVTATATATNNNAQSLTLTHASTEAYSSTTLFVRVGTPQGSAATADVIVTVNYLT